MTLGDLDRWLKEHGIEEGIGAVAVDGIRIVPERRGDRSSPLQLVVTVFVRGTDGKRFLDDGTGDAAREVKFIPCPPIFATV